MRWLPALVCLMVTAAVAVYVWHTAQHIHEVARRDRTRRVIRQVQREQYKKSTL